MSQLLHLNKPIYRLIAIALCVSIISSIGVFYFEYHNDNPQFQTIPDLLFFWVALVTTVGAAISPMTTDSGEILAIVAMLSGTFMYFAAFSEMILWIKERYDSKYKGIRKYTGSNHVIIVGYNSLSLGIIHLLDRILMPEIDIVLVTSRIDSNPDYERVVFVNEHPATTTALSKAKVEAANIAIILSNDEVSPEKMDMNTMLIGGMIEELNNEVFTIVELSNNRKASTFQEFQVDETITFDELLDDTRHRDVKPNILKKIPKELIETMVREEYR